jgi:hypothetical protein
MAVTMGFSMAWAVSEYPYLVSLVSVSDECIVLDNLHDIQQI